MIVTYRSHAEEADAVVASIGELGRTAVALQLDVDDVSSFDAFAETLRETWDRDTFDYLVNHGGVQITAAFADVTEADFDRLVNVHFKGVFFLTQKLLPLLADGGSIVNISTGQTRFYTPERAVYAAAKGAVATDFSDGLLRDTPAVQEAIAALLGDGNRWVTGRRVEASGGVHL